jgi:hypothetical protein
MAREVELDWLMHNLHYKDHLLRFADLIRADEREETDRLRALCDDLLSELYVYRASKYLKDTTEAIRARSNT